MGIPRPPAPLLCNTWLNVAVKVVTKSLFHEQMKLQYRNVSPRATDQWPLQTQATYSVGARCSPCATDKLGTVVVNFIYMR